MKLPFFIGWRYVSSRQRDLLVAFLSRVCMAGLIVGVGLLIVVLSIMNGFDRELRERILSLLPQASIYHRYGIDDWQVLQTRIEQHPKVVAAAPFVELRALIGLGTQAEPVGIYGIQPEIEQNVSDVSQFLQATAAGQTAGLQSLSPQEPGLIIGFAIAQKLGVTLGDSVMVIVPDAVNARAAPKVTYAKIVDILKTGTEVDAKLALMHLEQAKLLAPGGLVSGMRLKLYDLFDAHNVAWDLVMDFGSGYYGNSWLSTHGNLHHAIKMSKSLVGLLMSLIVGIAAFNVVSSLIMVVVEKQGAIAILRTLGASTREIMAVFVVQGAIIGIVGALLGVVLGVGLSLIVSDTFAFIESFFGLQLLQSDVYPLTYLPTDILLADLVRVASTAIFLCLVATLYPAWKASRVNPAEALRYE